MSVWSSAGEILPSTSLQCRASAVFPEFGTPTQSFAYWVRLVGDQQANPAATSATARPSAYTVKLACGPAADSPTGSSCRTTAFGSPGSRMVPSLAAAVSDGELDFPTKPAGAECGTS